MLRPGSGAESESERGSLLLLSGPPGRVDSDSDDTLISDIIRLLCVALVRLRSCVPSLGMETKDLAV